MRLLAGEPLGQRDAFFFGLVRQHRALDDVADGIDAGQGGGVVRVDGDAALVVDSQAAGAETAVVGGGATADRHEHDVGAERLRMAAGRGLDRHPTPIARTVHPDDPVA